MTPIFRAIACYCLLLLLLISSVESFSTQSSSPRNLPVVAEQALQERRQFLGSLVAAATSMGIRTSAAWADDNEATIYKTGKAPIVPGQKPKDKNDVLGTRKDPNFLRSIADCKSKCESSYGPDGMAKSKEDCLSECQDICCKTYEQCTFAIVPRI